MVNSEAERQKYYQEGFRMPRGFWPGFFKTELQSKQAPLQLLCEEETGR